jgi:hypothetical protein
MADPRQFELEDGLVRKGNKLLFVQFLAAAPHMTLSVLEWQNKLNIRCTHLALVKGYR